MSLTQINKAGLDEIALDHVFTIGATGDSAHYTFQGEGLNGTVNDPTLYLTRGKTYRFENGSGGHPIRIQSTSGANGTAYNTGVTNNAQAGTVIVEVQHDAPDVLYYQCTSHAAMNGILYITGALADGNVTTAKLANNAVTTAKIAANAVDTTELAVGAVTHDQLADNTVDADHLQSNAVITSKIADSNVTTAKIANNAVTNPKIVSGAIDTGHLVNNSVTTVKLADQAVTLDKLPHGTSSNNGKFLRANNGADPSFESIPAGVTINNQSDNRVITATGTTDTLNAESNVVIDANGRLGVGTASPDNELQVQKSNAGGDVALRVTNATGTDAGTTASLYLTTSPSTNFNTTYLQAKRADGSFNIGYGTNSPSLTVLGSSGRVGIGETAPDGDLHIKSSNPAIYLEDSSNSSQHGQAIIEQNGDNLKIRQDAGNASSGSNSNISFQIDAAERVKIAHLGDSEYGLKFLNSKAIEFKDSNMEICTLTWSINANTWTNFFSGAQNHMSWLFINGIHNSGNSSALWALSDSYSGGSSYATRKIHQNNYSPANIDIQRNGVWWQIRSSYSTYGYAILMVLSGAGSVANLSG